MDFLDPRLILMIVCTTKEKKVIFIIYLKNQRTKMVKLF